MSHQGSLSQAYQEAYQDTDSKKAGGLEPGSEAEKQAVQKFCKFFGSLTEENVRAQVRSVYAPNIYFNDTLREIRGIDALEKYLIRTTQEVDSCTVEVLDTVSQKGEYYIRWRMDILFKHFRKGETQSSIGITHIRFNKEGQVIFHQDYWDAASNFFEKVPVVGWFIRKVRAKL